MCDKVKPMQAIKRSKAEFWDKLERAVRDFESETGAKIANCQFRTSFNESYPRIRNTKSLSYD